MAEQWRVVANDGFRFERNGEGLPIRSRGDAVNVAYRIAPMTTSSKLDRLHVQTADGEKITVNGWTIEPMKSDA